MAIATGAARRIRQGGSWLFADDGAVAALVAVALGLYLSSFYSYLLFHSLVELTTVAIAFTLFMLAWNARGFLTNDCYKVLGIGYASISIIDLVHTLGFKGMDIFPGYGTNLAPQLWIAARFLQAVTLCVAPLFVNRKVNEHLLLGIYIAAVAVVLALVFSGHFPDCYIDGQGLTPFKVVSEYVITAILLGSLVLFRRARSNFTHRVYMLIVSSILLTAGSEIAFTAYISAYGFANLVGHLFKLAAFYLIYRALLVTSFREPFDLIFRDLKQAECALLKANESLEERVRQRTAELEASEAKYRRIVDTANEGIWMLGPDTTTIFVNAKMAEMLGYSSSEMLGRSATNFMFEEDAPNHARKMENRRLGLAENYEARFRRKDGQEIWAVVSATAIFDEEHRYAGSFAMFTDVTNRKRAENEIVDLNKELMLRLAALEQANSELEAFSYSVSHDLRTPLRAINGFVAILLNEYRARIDEQGQRYLDVVRRSSLRMGGLIDGLLEFIRQSRREMRLVNIDMTALTGEVCRVVLAAEPRRKINLQIGELPPAFGDETMITEVLDKLIHNAVKFTAGREEARIEIGGEARKGETVYYIKDNGVGFDMRYAEKLFGVFLRLHSADEFEGAGAGLAIVKRIIDRHNGRVWVEGKLDEGATFHFALPQREASTPAH